MATASGYTAEDLETVRMAILSGVKSVTVGGRTKVFHDLAATRDLFNQIAAELAAVDAPVQRTRRVGVMVVY